MAQFMFSLESISASSVEELTSIVTDYLNDYQGHVVNSLYDAYLWYKSALDGEVDYDDVHYTRDSQRSVVTLEDGFNYVVRIDEIGLNGNADDYCYTISVYDQD